MSCRSSFSRALPERRRTAGARGNPAWRHPKRQDTEHLVSEWTRFGHLKEKPDPKTMAALTTTGRDGTKLSIEMIGERTAMLADVRAHVNTMLVDLAELMMFVAQQN